MITLLFSAVALATVVAGFIAVGRAAKQHENALASYERKLDAWKPICRRDPKIAETFRQSFATEAAYANWLNS